MAAPLDLGRHLEDGIVPLLSVALFREKRLDLVRIWVHEQLGTAKAHALEHVFHNRKELDVEHGLGQDNVTKVSRAKGILLLTSHTDRIVLDDTHPRIKDPVSHRIITVVRLGLVNLGYRARDNLIRTKNTKLNTLDSTNIIVI